MLLHGMRDRLQSSHGVGCSWVNRDRAHRTMRSRVKERVAGCNSDRSRSTIHHTARMCIQSMARRQRERKRKGAAAGLSAHRNNDREKKKKRRRALQDLECHFLANNIVMTIAILLARILSTSVLAQSYCPNARSRQRKLSSLRWLCACVGCQIFGFKTRFRHFHAVGVMKNYESQAAERAAG